jgi:hypothetical protein
MKTTHPINIAVVDDHALPRQLMTGILTSMGFEFINHALTPIYNQVDNGQHLPLPDELT